MGAHFNDSAIPDGLKDTFARSAVALTLADPRLDDCPLVGVNDVFCEISGYDAEAILGRNCRFLQPEGGAGPVRERMRKFLSSDKAEQEKFVVPNQEKDGTPFLNLLYMAKLRSDDGKRQYVLGSQFRILDNADKALAIYEEALRTDLKKLNLISHENNFVMLGSYDALASSHSIIAQAKIG